MSYFQEEVDKLFPGCMTGKMFIEYNTMDPKGLRLGIEDPFYSQALEPKFFGNNTHLNHRKNHVCDTIQHGSHWITSLKDRC